MKYNFYLVFFLNLIFFIVFSTTSLSCTALTEDTFKDYEKNSKMIDRYEISGKQEVNFFLTNYRNGFMKSFRDLPLEIQNEILIILNFEIDKLGENLVELSKKSLSYNDYKNKTYSIYKDIYCDEDIKGVNEFYKSDLGRKYLEKNTQSYERFLDYTAKKIEPFILESMNLFEGQYDSLIENLKQNIDWDLYERKYPKYFK